MSVVWYPESCNQVASELLSSNFANPPLGGAFDSTPVVCEYSPVRNVVRDGQHNGFDTWKFVKVTPWLASSAFVFGMYDIASNHSSSVMMTTMFGCVAARARGALLRPNRVMMRKTTTIEVGRRGVLPMRSPFAQEVTARPSATRDCREIRTAGQDPVACDPAHRLARSVNRCGPYAAASSKVISIRPRPLRFAR